MFTPLYPKSDRTVVPLYTPGWESLSWNVSGFGVHDQMLLHVLDVCKTESPRLPYVAVHGSPLCAWNGGRLGSMNILDSTDFRGLVQQYNSRGISVYLTFTKYDITDFDDTWCWAMTRILTEHDYPLRNGVIVSNKQLYGAIHTKYPDLTILSSILLPTYASIKQTIDAAWYNEQLTWADIVILHPDHAFDTKLLEDIHDKDRVEILANEPCMFKCPTRAAHYRAFDDVATAGTNPLPHKVLTQILNNCQQRKDVNTIKHTCMLTRADIERLHAMGYYRFKLQGRSMPVEGMINDIARYLFDPYGYFHELMQGPSPCI